MTWWESLCVDLTTNLLECLDAIDVFLLESDVGFTFDDLLTELRTAAIPNLRHFLRIGRCYLDNPPQLAEVLSNSPDCLPYPPTFKKPFAWDGSTPPATLARSKPSIVQQHPTGNRLPHRCHGGFH